MSFFTTELLFGAGLVAGGIVLIGLVVSTHSSSHRFWPHGKRDWTFWLGWTSWTVYFGCVLGVSYLDWQEAYRVSTIGIVVGVVLILAGTIVSLWAVWHLGIHESTGLKGHLVTGGPYRYSRNPQYVGFIALIIGWILVVGSWLVAILGLVGIVWFLLAPLAEEPWLREQYGDDYEAYCEAVSRFIGRSHRQ